MNFDFMWELRQPWGYPAALAAMLASGVILYVLFKRRGWL
jgi:magnesium transporter